MNAVYKVEILDKALNPITIVRNLVSINSNKEVLDYSQELSYFGQCRLRIGTNDPMFDLHGDILKPYANSIRVSRNGYLVWEGIIVSCPSRNFNFIEVKAYTFLFLLSKMVLPHDTADSNFRTFQSGTMAQAVTAIVNDAKTAAGPNSPLANLAVGTIENPNFPANFTNTAGVSIAGQPWVFSPELPIKFDFKDTFYCLQSMAMYAAYDFELVTTQNPVTGVVSLTFNFKKFIGNKQPQLAFTYGGTGAIEDYDSPLNGERMANNILGTSADNNNVVLKAWQGDPASINTYGQIQDVAGYLDAKNINILRSRIVEELKVTATPDAEVNISLNDKAYPLGQYGIGDTVTIQISDHIIQVNQVRRIVGIDVRVHNTGKETIHLNTNIPRETQQ